MNRVTTSLTFPASFWKMKRYRLFYLFAYINEFLCFVRSFWNLQQWLKNMLRSELTEFEMDIELEEIILKEIIDEQYQWYALFLASTACLPF